MSENRIRILAALDDKVSSGLDRIRDKFDQLGGKGTGASFFGNVGAKGLEMIGGAARKAGEAVGDFIGDSIDAASDLEQSVGGVEAVFGPAADKITKFGETADKALGLSKNAVNEMATTIGAKLQGMGFEVDAAADKTLELQKRGADLAATFGGTTTDAVNAISSLLSGERDPIERYGVSIKEADVQARILAKGLDTSTTEAKKNATAIASLELLMEQTAKATGRFAAETESAAGSLQIQNAELVNLQANLGEKLLPAQKAVTGAQIDLITAVGAFADELSGKVTPETLALDKALGVSADAYTFSADKLRSLTEETLQTAQALGILTEGEVNAELAARQVADSIANMASAAKDDGAIIVSNGRDIGGIIETIGRKAGTAEEQFEAATEGMVSDVRAAKAGLSDAGTDLADALFDPQIAKLEKWKNERAIKETQAAIASGKLRGEELVDAKIKLAELRKDRLGLLVTLAESGDKASADSLRAQAAVALASKNLTADQRTYWNTVLAKLAAVDRAAKNLDATFRRLLAMSERTKDDIYIPPAISTGNAPQPRSVGGPVVANRPYIVGEERAELFVPSSSGYILPSVPAGGGRREPTVVHTHIYLDGRQITDVVSEYLAYDFDRAAPTSVRQ